MGFDYAALVAGALENIGGGGGGLVQFIKDGDTTVKLVPMDESGQFFTTYTSIYKGQPQQSALISCIIISADAEGVADKARVRFLKVPPTVVRSLIGLMQKGWELLDETSETVSITRGKGKGGKTEYRTDAIKRKFSYTDIEMPEQTLAEAGAEQEARELEKNAPAAADLGEAF